MVLGYEARSPSLQPASIFEKRECVSIRPDLMLFGIRPGTLIRPMNDIKHKEVKIDVKDTLHTLKTTPLQLCRHVCRSPGLVPAQLADVPTLAAERAVVSPTASRIVTSA